MTFLLALSKIQPSEVLILRKLIWSHADPVLGYNFAANSSKNFMTPARTCEKFNFFSSLRIILLKAEVVGQERAASKTTEQLSGSNFKYWPIRTQLFVSDRGRIWRLFWLRLICQWRKQNRHLWPIFQGLLCDNQWINQKVCK